MSRHLQSVESHFREQNAYQGLDSLAETQLHPLLCQAFADSYLGVLREVGYPSSPKSRPNESQRQRCDLVLTPNAGQLLFDPIDEQRAQDRALGTLFESYASQYESNPDDALPQDAFWIEVKLVGQFSYVDGVPGPNPKYTNELLIGPKADVVKLASDPLIHYGASLIVLFAEHQETGPHDIAASATAMLDHDLPISVPVFETFEITNYAGNAWCTLGLIPVRL